MKESFSIQLIFYGVRGSLPVCEREFQTFGGNTTCIAVRTQNTGVMGIMDAGSGIRLLGKDILAGRYGDVREFYIGFSHFHWDHIQGFPFFAPAYEEGYRLHMMALGEGRAMSKFRELFEVQMREEYFPVSLEALTAEISFEQPGNASGIFQGVEVEVIPHSHPGGAYSRKIICEGKRVVVSTDIEHGENLDERLIEFSKGADVLVHEAQYTEEQLQRHRGWGHSSYDQAIEVAKRAQVGKLILTHHDPNHDDDFLHEQEMYCKSRFSDCVLAREGMVISI